MGNITNTGAENVFSSYNAMHSLEDPYSPVVQRLEDDANKAADLHHVCLKSSVFKRFLMKITYILFYKFSFRNMLNIEISIYEEISRLLIAN